MVLLHIYFKWIVRNTDALKSADPPTNSGYLTPQANTVHTAGVGAADEKQIFSELELESFSSAGGTPLWFDRDGSRKAKPMVLEQPRFVGPDGYVTQITGGNAEVTIQPFDTFTFFDREQN